MTGKLEPKTLKGFNDYFSDDMKIRDFIRNIFRTTAISYGFEALETPALEYSELILGQSGDEAEKLYYRFQDNGGRDVMLKYELMIPMCRAVAQNYNNIAFPYKRYQIQNVWRAENVQKGRLREFTQMDIDILGSSSPMADAEVIQFGLAFLKSLGFKKYVVRINSREIIKGLIDAIDIDEKYFEDVYIAIDKLKKVGSENVKKELVEKGIEEKKAEKLLSTLNLTLEEIGEIIKNTESGEKGVRNIEEIIDIVKTNEEFSEFVKFDATLTRGLASYTGAVWEYEVIDGDVGSVSGGGRYDRAVSKYIGKEIPATGTSFGLERLMEIIKDREMLNAETTNDSILLIPASTDCIGYTMRVAFQLREAGIITSIYPDIQKFKTSLKYADRKETKWVGIIGEDEMNQEKIQLKNMLDKSQNLLSTEEVISRISKK